MEGTVYFFFKPTAAVGLAVGRKELVVGRLLTGKPAGFNVVDPRVFGLGVAGRNVFGFNAGRGVGKALGTMVGKYVGLA